VDENAAKRPSGPLASGRGGNLLDNQFGLVRVNFL
jgi:hypothetical protein